MAKSLIKRLFSYVAPIGISAIIFGCATTNPYLNKSNSAKTESTESYFENEERDRIARELGVADYSRIVDLGNEYKTNKSGVGYLQTAAGIMVGSVKVSKTDNGYEAEGFFSQYLYPEIFDKICKIADRDENKLITEKEARDLLTKAYEIAIGE